MCEAFVQTLKDEHKCYQELYGQILRTNKIYNRNGKTKPRVPILVKYFVEKIGLDKNKTMQTACLSGNLEIVKYLEEKYYMNVVDQECFRLACQNNYIDLVKYMIDKGYDVKSEQSYSLRLASKYGYMELTKYFIEKGAKISDGNYKSITKSSKYGQLEVVGYLFECEEIPQRVINQAFIYACFNGYYNVAEYLEGKGATCEEINFSHFELICRLKYYRIVELLYQMNYMETHQEERYVNLIEENFGKKSLDQLKFSRRMRFLRLISAFSQY